MRRKVIPELLDDDLGSPPEVAASLVDLRHINDLVRGDAHDRRSAAAGCQEAGAAGFRCSRWAPARAMCRLAARRPCARGIAKLRLLCWIACGRICHATVRARLRAMPCICPFGDGAFDVVSCSLFAHHLEPDDLRRFAAKPCGFAAGRC